jgi:hypothetical protein
MIERLLGVLKEQFRLRHHHIFGLHLCVCNQLPRFRVQSPHHTLVPLGPLAKALANRCAATVRISDTNLSSGRAVEHENQSDSAILESIYS